jgi:hypothetical protein
VSVRFALSVREKRETFFAPPSLFDLATAEAAAEAAAEATGRTPLEAFWASSVCAIPRHFIGGVIPSPVKIADQMWSMFVLQNLTSVNWVRLPCSTYSVGLRLIAFVGFWDTGVESVPEDYHTALKLYWGTSGRARCEPIYHPVLYQHIEGGSYFGTISQRFQQGVRHMWGATDLAYIMWLMCRMPIVPFFSQLRIIATVTDVHISSAACVGRSLARAKAIQRGARSLHPTRPAFPPGPPSCPPSRCRCSRSSGRATLGRRSGTCCSFRTSTRSCSSSSSRS